MNWLSIVSIFAKPLGAIVNKAIAAGAAAAISWSVAKGLPADSATMVVSSLALALSTVLSGFASTQGVQIPIINADPQNGVKVVAATAAVPTVNAPLA